ncbi:MAG: hypothetical protein ACR5K9_01095 [Wolbachia sp.]
MKKLFTLAVLLTSSLAGVAEDVTDLESKYYVGLNLGAGLGGGLDDGFGASLTAIAESGVVFGYHYDKSSKFELEAFCSLKSSVNVGSSIGTEGGVEIGGGIGTSLLANYRFYPISDPVKLYVSGGLGPYFQPISLSLDISSKTSEKGDETRPEKEGENAQNNTQTGGLGDMLRDIKDELPKKKEYDSPLDGLLDSIAYKLKVGIDYDITQRIVGTVGVTIGGRLLGLKALKVPDATLEVGVRYNF